MHLRFRLDHEKWKKKKKSKIKVFRNQKFYSHVARTNWHFQKHVNLLHWGSFWWPAEGTSLLTGYFVHIFTKAWRHLIFSKTDQLTFPGKPSQTKPNQNQNKQTTPKQNKIHGIYWCIWTKWHKLLDWSCIDLEIQNYYIFATFQWKRKAYYLCVQIVSSKMLVFVQRCQTLQLMSSFKLTRTILIVKPALLQLWYQAGIKKNEAFQERDMKHRGRRGHGEWFELSAHMQETWISLT